MQDRTPRYPPSSQEQLHYQSPGAHQKSQWVTDDGPGGKWLVGCLIVASIVGVVVAGIGGIIWFFFTGF